ncbi:iron ABC transporter permease [Rhizobiales bacterium L72]|uniref:Iron ABC transporter permease n=2 Tax=Propylenella binzhouense TaxID=2555902 RepID=A0A964T7W6_9HYPH|nr:iron ABC transporter permease [Propylenella binzhouense]
MPALAAHALPQGRFAGDRTRLGAAVILCLAAGLLAVAVLSISAGASGFTPARALATLPQILDRSGSAAPARDALIVLDIRLPRTLLGMVVGAALAVSGCVLQGFFRNPLADPTIVGVSGGAALAAVIVIVGGGAVLAPLPDAIRVLALPLAAFAGALVSTVTVYRLATGGGRTSVATLLLAGIGIAALANAGVGLTIFMSDDAQLRDFTFWSLGSLGGATWGKLAVAVPLFGAVLAVLPRLAAGLDALLLGETEAHYLGIPVEAVKRIAIAAVAAAVGGAVAVAGPIGFVGLVVPHLLRLAIGPLHRLLLPACALAGASLLVLADIVCRTIVAPAELPIGIVTALIGAPFFLWLLLRRRALVES